MTIKLVSAEPQYEQSKLTLWFGAGATCVHSYVSPSSLHIGTQYPVLMRIGKHIEICIQIEWNASSNLYLQMFLFLVRFVFNMRCIFVALHFIA